MEVVFSRLNWQEERRIRQQDWYRRKRIGSGATAVVHPFGRHKVVRDQTYQEDYDPASHLEWAKFCISSRSKHVPKIDFIGVWRDEEGSVERVVTVLERLKPIPEVLVCGGEEYETDDICFWIDDYIQDYEPKERLRLLPKEVKKMFPPRAMARMRTRLKKENIYWNDMHGGNMMLRGKTMVVTDPIC
jgi:hypothetical protein